VPGFGTLRAGVTESRPAALEAALDARLEATEFPLVDASLVSGAAAPTPTTCGGSGNSGSGKQVKAEIVPLLDVVLPPTYLIDSVTCWSMGSLLGTPSSPSGNGRFEDEGQPDMDRISAERWGQRGEWACASNRVGARAIVIVDAARAERWPEDRGRAVRGDRDVEHDAHPLPAEEQGGGNGGAPGVRR
jgi:hypothetical protein